MGSYCRGCAKPLGDEVRADAQYCSAACRSRHWRWLRKSRSKITALRSAESQRTCAVCGKKWVAGADHRADAKYCSHRCRTRAWRCRSRSK